MGDSQDTSTFLRPGSSSRSARHRGTSSNQTSPYASSPDTFLSARSPTDFSLDFTAPPGSSSSSSYGQFGLPSSSFADVGGLYENGDAALLSANFLNQGLDPTPFRTPDSPTMFDTLAPADLQSSLTSSSYNTTMRASPRASPRLSSAAPRSASTSNLSQLNRNTGAGFNKRQSSQQSMFAPKDNVFPPMPPAFPELPYTNSNLAAFPQSNPLPLSASPASFGGQAFTNWPSADLQSYSQPSWLLSSSLPQSQFNSIQQYPTAYPSAAYSAPPSRDPTHCSTQTSSSSMSSGRRASAPLGSSSLSTSAYPGRMRSYEEYAEFAARSRLSPNARAPSRRLGTSTTMNMQGLYTKEAVDQAFPGEWGDAFR